MKNNLHRTVFTAVPPMFIPNGMLSIMYIHTLAIVTYGITSSLLDYVRVALARPFTNTTGYRLASAGDFLKTFVFATILVHRFEINYNLY